MDRAIAEPGRVVGRPIPLEPPAIERLESVSVPVLAVVGALDAAESSAAAQVLVDRVPSARAVLVPDVAHLIGLEAPAELAALIVEFLAPQPSWA
jgi:pimeloyl-ACP methyl ester carboxylesterase